MRLLARRELITFGEQHGAPCVCVWMGCGGSKGSLVGTTIQPYRGVSFEGSSFSMQGDTPVKDRRDPERRRAKLMESQKERVKLHRSQSWAAAPSKRASPAGHQLMSAQQLRDKGAQQEAVSSKSWSNPSNAARQPSTTPTRQRPKKAPGLKVDLPLNDCSGDLGNFWGTSPHSPQELQLKEIEEQKNNAHIGEAHSPISPVSIINAKKNAKQLRRIADKRKKQLSPEEKARRKKEMLQVDKRFMESMLHQDDTVTDSVTSQRGDEAQGNDPSPIRKTSRSAKTRRSLKPGAPVARESRGTGGG